MSNEQAVTFPVFKSVLGSLVKTVKSYVRDGLNDRCGALEARIKALEERPALQYRGVWSPDEAYACGDLVTHDGSMFHCWEATQGGRPAQTDAWQLCVKRGRDAR